MYIIVPLRILSCFPNTGLLFFFNCIDHLPLLWSGCGRPTMWRFGLGIRGMNVCAGDDLYPYEVFRRTWREVFALSFFPPPSSCDLLGG